MDIINEVRLVPNETLETLNINSTEFLNEVDKRDICGICKKSRKYFCYSCYVPMDCIKHKVPVVYLPLLVDIIKFPKEVDGKSTAAHAPILAPHQISIYSYPDIPEYTEKDKVLIVFPGKDAITLEDISNFIRQNLIKEDKCIKNENHKKIGYLPMLKTEVLSVESVKKEENVPFQCQNTLDDKLSDEKFCKESFRKLRSNFPFDKVIFIDSTWNQVQKINNDERLNGIQRLELKNRESMFWRYQRGKPRTYLSTIEAIYYFFVDIHTMFSGSPYEGEYDNLLFFFYFMYKKIHTLYDPKKLRVYSMKT